MTKGGLARLRPTDRKAPLKRCVRFVAHSSGARCVLCRTLPPENDTLMRTLLTAHAQQIFRRGSARARQEHRLDPWNGAVKRPRHGPHGPACKPPMRVTDGMRKAWKAGAHGGSMLFTEGG